MTRLPIVLLILLAWSSPAPAQDRPRLVSVGGDLTEIVFALGAGDLLVGADTTSTWPEAAGDLAKVGYMRQLAAESMLSLAPGMVLAADDAGPKSVLDRLASAGVDVRIAPAGASLAGVVEKIRFVGRALGREAEAEAAVDRLEAQMRAVDDALDGLDSRPRVLFLISVESGRMMAAGRGTSADSIIALARGANAITGFDGYAPINAEALIAARPDVLLLPGHIVARSGLEAVLSDPALATTPAVADGRIVVMDSLLLLGFGPRTPRAIGELARALHPDTAIAEAAD